MCRVAELGLESFGGSFGEPGRLRVSLVQIVRGTVGLAHVNRLIAGALVQFVDVFFNVLI